MQLATTVNKPVSKLQVKRFLFEMGGIEVIGSRDKKGFCQSHHFLEDQRDSGNQYMYQNTDL